MINNEIPINAGYTKHKPRWDRVEHVLDGAPKLKEIDLAKKGTYLRHIQPLDRSQYNVLRNEAYIKGAIFYNATERTVAGLTGMVFRVEPDIPDLTGDLEYLLTDTDGGGTGLLQHIKMVTHQVITKGRWGCLVDMPTKEEGVPVTKADVLSGFRPRMVGYMAQDILDWNVDAIGGVSKLDLVILKESTSQFEDDQRLKRVETDQYRILRLREGVYTQQVYDENGVPITEEFAPRDGHGAMLDFIPFQFFGSKNNDPVIDKIPIESLVDVNLGHYQNSADLESSSYHHSACQPVISDDAFSRQMYNPDSKTGKAINFGEQSLIVLGTGGTFIFAQPDPNTLANDLRASKEEQMIALGAQLISEGGQAETAEAARIKKASDASVLVTIVGNVSEAYTTMLGWVSRFLGVEAPDEEVKVNDNFFETKLTPEERKQIVAEWQAGTYSQRIAIDQLKKYGVIPKDEETETVIEEVQNELNLGGSLDAEEGDNSNT